MTEAGRQARAAYQREYRAKNREKVNQTAREWRKNHPEAVEAINNRYWEKKAAEAEEAANSDK